MTDAYVELHAHSAFSFLEGASVPEELAGACAEFGMPAMALVDRNGVYGAPRFHMAAKKTGIRAHIGSEIACANGLTYPLLAETREGYQNLCRLVPMRACLKFSANTTSTPSSSATTIARRKRATRPLWNAPAASVCRWSPPTVSPTPRPPSASCSMSSPACAKK
jgi:DNA polymerase III alpha subunit